MSKISRKRAAFVAAVAMTGLFLAVPMASAKDVEINTAITGEICGNTPNANGTCPDNDAPGNASLLSAMGNTVIINAAVTNSNNGNVMGAKASTLTATGISTVTGNALTITANGSSDGFAAGGWAWSEGLSTASGNTVKLNAGGTVAKGLTGGWADGGQGATANTNQVFVDGRVSATGVSGGYAYSRWGAAAATGNSVTINQYGNVVAGEIFGGFAQSISKAAEANDNSLTFSGTTAGSVYGGYAYFYPQEAPAVAVGSATATGNKVAVSGDASIGASVYGGYANATNDFNSDPISAATASKNSVTVNDGVITGGVFGGFINFRNNTRLTSGSAIGNTVTISGAPTLTGVELYGSYANETEGSRGISATNYSEFTGFDLFTGNTLNVWNYQGTDVLGAVENFEFLNFVFPVVQSGPVLNIGSGYLRSYDGKSSVITASTIGGTAPLSTGTVVTLIDATTALGATPYGPSLAGDGFDQTTAAGWHGATLRYEWTLNTVAAIEADDVLEVTLKTVKAAPEATVLSEGYLSALTSLVQSGDLVAGSGLRSAVSAGEVGLSGFGVVSGGKLRFNTGSHVDLKGLSFMAGLAKGLESGLTVGAFAEYGRGSYDTFNSFANAADLLGEGDTHHVGGGLLGKLGFGGSETGQPYVEASFRGGAVYNDYNGPVVPAGIIPDGTAYSFDAESAYLGLHVGAGYLLNFGAAELDLYGKYFWTLQGAETVTLASGDVVEFEAVHSNRLRAGARLSYAAAAGLAFSVGAAYEHELSGDANATTYGFAIEAPSLGGGTGIGELGVTWKPSETMPLSVGLDVQGYLGQRQGVTGSLQLKFEF